MNANPSALTTAQAALLCVYALGLAGGQLLFKAVALQGTPAPLAERILSWLFNPLFIAALALYFALTLVWVWILSFTPLSRAYPFVAVAFAVTPLLASLVFAEPLTMRLLFGLGLIVAGLFLVVG